MEARSMLALSLTLGLHKKRFQTKAGKDAQGSGMQGNDRNTPVMTSFIHSRASELNIPT